jgi:hypothetical protein
MKKKIYNMELRKDWVSGFIDGEGCFYIGIVKDKAMKLGYSVKLEFSITQHIRDQLLMESFILFFGCGVRRTKEVKFNIVLEMSLI